MSNRAGVTSAEPGGRLTRMSDNNPSGVKPRHETDVAFTIEFDASATLRGQ